MLFGLARSVCCVSELARAGLSAIPKLSELLKCLAGGRWRLRLEGITPSEMRLRGSRSRGGLKGTWGAFKGPEHRNWGSRNSGTWRAPELELRSSAMELKLAAPALFLLILRRKESTSSLRSIRLAWTTLASAGLSTLRGLASAALPSATLRQGERMRPPVPVLLVVSPHECWGGWSAWELASETKL